MHRLVGLHEPQVFVGGRRVERGRGSGDGGHGILNEALEGVRDIWDVEDVLSCGGPLSGEEWLRETEIEMRV